MKATIQESDFFSSGIVDLIKCPVCGGSYSHITRSSVRESHDKGEAWTGRGDCIELRFDGECGHIWNLCIGYHKGENYLFMEALRP